MRFLLGGPMALKDVRQEPLKFHARHDFLSPRYPCLIAPHGFLAFSALLVLRRSRNFNLALCSCDLLLPIEQPTSSAISLCSNPSTSCRTKIDRYPGGSASIARCSCKRSIEPSSARSGEPGSFLGESSSVSIVYSRGTI